MQIYEVRIGHGALLDMSELRTFLIGILSEEGAVHYANAMVIYSTNVWNSKTLCTFAT